MFLHSFHHGIQLEKNTVLAAVKNLLVHIVLAKEVVNHLVNLRKATVADHLGLHPEVQDFALDNSALTALKLC